MAIDIDASEQFIFSSARLLDRHRLAVLLHGAPAAPVLQALRAYRNTDGGFGHALEPDVRAPHSEPAAALHALEILAEIGALDDPMVTESAAWARTAAAPDGGLPFMLPAAASYPHAPWMAASAEGSFLTFAVAAKLWQAGSAEPWLRTATEWCWMKLEHPAGLDGYWVKFALDFLGHVPDHARAAEAIERLRGHLRPDGTIPVPGGTGREQLTPLALSPSPGSRSRVLFTQAQIDTGLDDLERGQLDDGGWTFDWLGWSPGQSVEWRGIMTLRALATLSAHGRIQVAGHR